MISKFDKSLVRYYFLIIFCIYIIYYYINNEHSFTLVIITSLLFIIGWILKIPSKFFFLLSIISLIITPIFIQINQLLVFNNDFIPEKIAKMVYVFIIVGLLREIVENRKQIK